ncbi:MAG: hypothetical protein ACOYB1_09510 [Limnohabitans sp.]
MSNKFLALSISMVLLAAVTVASCERGFFEEPLPPLPPANRGPIRIISASTEIDACYEAVVKNPQYDELKKKILIPYRDHTPSDMLTDKSKPTRNELLLLRTWYEQQSDCSQLYLDFIKRNEAPEKIVSFNYAIEDTSQALVNRLYTKEINYGEFNFYRLRMNNESGEKERAIIAEIKRDFENSKYERLMALKKLMTPSLPTSPQGPQSFRCRSNGLDRMNCDEN